MARKFVQVLFLHEHVLNSVLNAATIPDMLENPHMKSFSSQVSLLLQYFYGSVF